MTVLLDTHVFIWLDTDATNLSPAAVQVLNDPANRLLLSVASVWEMAIKVGAGKLQLSGDLAVVLTDQMTRNPISLLPISTAHCLGVRSLPRVHGDPFDRMLVAQAVAEHATILTCDTNIPRYTVPVLW